MNEAKAQLTIIKDSVWEKRAEIFTVMTIVGVILTFFMMYARAFLGTEMSDEAFYVAEAKAALEGNVPYAYANGTQAEGFIFLLIPVEALYRLFVPDLEGVFLFTRLCFVTYKLFIWFFVFNAFKRKLNLSKSLLLSALIIPLNGPILNFNYNTVPELTMFMVGCVLYDVIEQDAPHKKARLIFAGIMTGIACFANPGWAVALLVFIALIIIRVKDIKSKIQTLLYYGCSVLADVIIVVGSISAVTSFSKFWNGFSLMFFNKIPTDSMAPNRSLKNTLMSFSGPVFQLILIFVPIGIVVYFLLSKYSDRLGLKMSKRETVFFSVAVAYFLHSMYIIITRHLYISVATGGEIRGFITVCYMLMFVAAGACRKNKIILYLALYQPIYAIAEIMIVSVDSSIWRFINAYTVVIPLLYILLRNRYRTIRMMSGVLAVATVVSLGYANYKRIYRDFGFNKLTDQVQTGVFKNLYTSHSRATDFPELEEYLNSVIEEDESYAFRDNVPFAYIMVHKGKPCEMMTWDALQYHHKRNSPAPMFDYYKRRDMIPDKIIYIDFGKDERLSILDPEFRYNDWVNAYYDLVDDVKLNDTFFRVMVYKYNGTFDGNYQKWVDSYLPLVK